MSSRFHDKTAVITGGATGIGLAIARRFATDGAYVFITGRRQSALDAAVAGIDGKVEAVRADSSSLADLDMLYRTVRERRGSIDILVANSGGGVRAVLGDITEEQVDAMLATNVKGVIFTVQKALPLLSEKASVILTGSTTSVRVAPGQSVYGATKAAVRSLARGWAVDLAGRSIRVNVLSPGPTRTPGLLGRVAPDRHQAALDAIAAHVPLGRVAEPDEIAAAAAFLASDEASFVNGIEFFADGGQGQI
jgi:NAD(P)-dependent dehydrogenase (short-subunit alcohol dehydrogenase family)